MGTFSNYLENKWLDHLLSTPFAVPTTVALALHTADPGEDASGAEVTDANNYARVSCKAQFATAAATRIISNDGDITFNTASGSWGTVTHWALWDSASHGAGNMLAYGAFSSGKAVGNGQTPKVLTGEIDISIPASNGMTTYLANEMLDHTFLNSDPGFSQPTIYLGLGTGAFADTGVFTNEVADSGAYARIAVAAWTVSGSGAENTGAATFTTATGSWGTVSDWFLADNGSHATGNMLLYGTFDASNAITTDDQANIPAGDLDITQD
jgi:hypothetical protein